MKVKIRDIPQEGLEFTQSVPAESLGLSEADIHSISLLIIKAVLEKIENTILAHLEVRGTYSFVCARCLDVVEKSQADIFDFDYPVEKGLEAIDLGEDIRQELILRRPVKVLCREDCQGICLKCGANLNREECRCQR